MGASRAGSGAPGPAWSTAGAGPPEARAEPALSHYFQTPDRDDGRPGSVPLRLGDRTVELATGSGVFSRHRLDPGTEVLLEVLPPPPAAGDLLDLGCGYGPLALTLAAAAPAATVWAIDVNARARELCAANAVAAGLANVRVLAAEEVPAGVRFAAVCSNPPVRVGKAPLRALLVEWLSRLDGGGTAHLVVHRNLGADSLHRWLVESGWPTERVASRRGYRVLRCAARRSPTGAPPTARC